MNDLNQRFQDFKEKIAPSFDFATRYLCIQNTHVYLLFLSSLTDSKLLSYLVESVVITASHDVELTVYPAAVEKTADENKAIIAMLSGQCVLLCENSDAYYIICLLYTSPSPRD